MFTGIIEGTGKLLEKRSGRAGLVFRLEAGFELTDPSEGESIAVDGICLTAYQIEGRRFSVDVSPESLSRSTLGDLSVGEQVNMERALKLSDRLGGHIVSGHVDCIASVSKIEILGDYTIYSFTLSEDLGRYIIEKGSVTINGISLTVNQCSGSTFAVSIIPHTMKSTTLMKLQKGSKVNIEVDIIGKYVEKLLLADPQTKKTQADRIHPGFLAKHGFL